MRARRGYNEGRKDERGEGKKEEREGNEEDRSKRLRKEMIRVMEALERRKVSRGN